MKTIPKEYTAIKNSFLDRGYSLKESKGHASRIFYSRYGITVKEAHMLWKKGKWDGYLIEGGFKTKMKCRYCGHEWLPKVRHPQYCPKCSKRLQ